MGINTEYSNAPLIEASFAIGHQADVFGTGETDRLADLLKNKGFSEQERCDDCSYSVLFENKDKSMIVGQKKTSVHIHRLDNYEWENFKKDVVLFSNELTNIAGSEKITWIKMSYTNLIRRTADGNIGEYINIYPTIKGDLKDIQNPEFRIAVKSKTDDPKGVCTIIVENVISKKEPCILFEISVRSKSQDDMGAWSESAHAVIKEMFERGITDVVRNRIE